MNTLQADKLERVTKKLQDIEALLEKLQSQNAKLEQQLQQVALQGEVTKKLQGLEASFEALQSQNAKLGQQEQQLQQSAAEVGTAVSGTWPGDALLSTTAVSVLCGALWLLWERGCESEVVR